MTKLDEKTRRALSFARMLSAAKVAKASAQVVLADFEPNHEKLRKALNGLVAAEEYLVAALRKAKLPHLELLEEDAKDNAWGMEIIFDNLACLPAGPEKEEAIKALDKGFGWAITKANKQPRK